MFIQNILAKLADSAADTTEFWSDLYTKRYTSEKIPSRCPLDASDKEQGRSMVEMLGVLAIVGVLSVGAISGYSKAMMKYKLNKHAEAVNMLLNNVLAIKDKMRPGNDELTLYGTLLYKMNLLPDGIKYIDNDFLYDTYFKESIWVFYYTSSAFGGIGFSFKPTSQGAEVCRNIILAAKENAADLESIYTYKFLNGEDENISIEGMLYGDSYCTGDRSCLRNLDINKINNLCNICDEKDCKLYITWK